MAAVELRVRLGELDAAVGARATPRAREREAGDQPRERIGVLEQPLELARGGARGPASRQTASRVSAGGGSKRHVGGSRRRPGLGLAPSAAAAARAPRTKHSLRLLEASRLAPWRPVQAHSPTASRPGSELRPVEVGGDAAHHVVRGGRDRDGLGGRVEAGLAQGLEDVGEALVGSMPRRSSSDVVGAVGVHPVEDRER